MLTYPEIDPVAFQLGPLAVHWYGLTYLVAFALGWWLGWLRARASGGTWQTPWVADLAFYAALGAVVGGRIGYMLFYDFGDLVTDPLALFRIWEGGMSFHGGFLGALVGSWLFGRRVGKGFFQVTDFLAPLVPLGLAAGRIGNFINGELWGRPTEMPWGMVFPGAGEVARHPSQLYQAGLEGVALFVILWWFTKRPRPTMAPSGMFLVGYGVSRSLGEVFREPDAHIGFIAWGWLTMGQLLSLPMILGGIILLALAYRGGRVVTDRGGA